MFTNFYKFLQIFTNSYKFLQIFKISTLDCKVVFEAFERRFGASDWWPEALGRDRLGILDYL